MTTTGQIAFDGIWDALPDARVRLRTGTHTIERAISSGVTLVKQLLSDPSKNESTINVRYVQSSENALSPILDGQRFYIQLNGETRWLPFEVSTRKPSAGIVTIEARSLSSDIVRAFRNEVANHPEFNVTLSGDDLSAVGLRSEVSRESELSEFIGRADPETMTVKFILSEIGGKRTGDTITLNGVAHNIEQMAPDAADILVDLTVKKRRVAT